MFPDNEFFQCPSYTYSSFLIGIVVSLIIWMITLINKDLGGKAALLGGLVMFCWALRTLWLWVSPYEGCETKGYPGQHYGNPFYSEYIEKVKVTPSSPPIEESTNLEESITTSAEDEL